MFLRRTCVRASHVRFPPHVRSPFPPLAPRSTGASFVRVREFVRVRAPVLGGPPSTGARTGWPPLYVRPYVYWSPPFNWSLLVLGAPPPPGVRTCTGARTGRMVARTTNLASYGFRPYARTLETSLP